MFSPFAVKFHNSFTEDKFPQLIFGKPLLASQTGPHRLHLNLLFSAFAVQVFLPADLVA